MAFSAGIVNVVGFLSFEHQAVTHVTGTTSLLAAALVDGRVGAAAQLLAGLLSFALGAAASGVLIRDTPLQLGRRYAIVLALQACLLLLAAVLLGRGSNLGTFSAIAACGLQNGMTTIFSGALIRTSHVSGMLTDLGIVLGHLLRGLPVQMRRLHVCVTVISGFFCGGIAGGRLFRDIGTATLYLSAVIALVSALACLIHHRRERPRADARQDEAAPPHDATGR